MRGLTFCCGGERVGTIAAKADANPTDHAESNGLTALTSDSYATVPSILATAMFDLFCFTTSRRTKGVWDVGLVRETLVLRDGRKLTYFLDGPLLHRERVPHIFVFHAMCLSGTSFLMTNAPQDFIVVCVNRPGYFGSDPPSAPTYSYASFAEDIEQLADALEVDSYFVAGHSSGGPCALACAAFSSDRVRAIGILGGDPEYARPTVPNKKQSSVILLGYVLPFLLNWVLWCLPPARKTRDGLVNDYRLETAIYPFCTEDIRQATLVFVGAADAIVPWEVSRHVHERLQNATLKIVPQVGHLGLLRDGVLQELFVSLVSLDSSTAPRRASLAFRASS